MDGRGFEWRAFVRTPWAVLAVWLAYALVRLAIQPLLGWEPVGPDDWTRLLQVRAWLDGQSFWDVTQYRMNPPEGFSMHWSRLVDLPLAAMMLLFGETAALVLVPLLWLLPALFALRAIMLRLNFPPLAFAFGLVIMPLFPMLPGNFAPMRIDHHAPQAVLALVCAALLLRDSRWSAVACGLCAAAWVEISLEGLPLVAVLAGLYGLRYLWAEQRLLHWFFIPFSVLLAAWDIADYYAVFFLSAGPSEFHCDVVGWRHIEGFLICAVVLLVATHWPWQRSAGSRLASLAISGAVCVIIMFAILGPCATNPMTELDPMLQEWWHGFIAEGLPIWKQAPSVALTLVWTIAVIVFGWWRAHCRGLFHQGRALPCTLLFLFALAAGGYSLLVMREGVVAQLLAIPFAALLMAEFLPRARAIAAPVPRIVATLAAVGLTTPLFASAFAAPLDDLAPRASMAADVRALVEQGSCDYSRLAALEPGLVVAPFDAGLEILGTSDHTILAASYHRNQVPMVELLKVLTGPAEQAREILARKQADYVAICGAAGDVALYRSAAPDNFANALVSGDVPEWLVLDERVSAGSLRVYRTAF